MRFERYLFGALGSFFGALAGYSHNNSTSYAIVMAATVTAGFLGGWIGAQLVIEFATSRLRVILRKPSSNERNDA